MVTLLHNIRNRPLSLALLFVIVATSPVFTAGGFRIAQETLEKAKQKYGSQAERNLLSWQDLIQRDNGKTDEEKLEEVNQFFNRMEYVKDIDHWGVEDYWATPVEFLASQGGDCEDFSVAKYFTLKALGVSEDKLNITYVKALRLNQAHMVLTYYRTPGAEPLILDNLVKQIKPASERPDLLPIYSFNGSGLWLAKQRGQGKFAGSSSRLQRWQDLLQRMMNGTI